MSIESLSVEERMLAVLSESPDIPTHILNLTQAFYQYQLSRKIAQRQAILRAMKLCALDLIASIDAQSLKLAVPDQQWDTANLGQADGST